jgi:hypothetical protein
MRVFHDVYLCVSRRINAQLDARAGGENDDFGLADPDLFSTATADHEHGCSPGAAVTCVDAFFGLR